MRFPLRSGVVQSPISPNQFICRRLLSTTPVYLKNSHPKSRNPSNRRPTQIEKLRSIIDRESRGTSVSHGHDPKSRLRSDKSGKSSGRHGLFRSTVLSLFNKILSEPQASRSIISGIDGEELSRQSALFMDALDAAFAKAENNITQRDKNPLFWSLREAFIQKDVKGLTTEVKYLFQSFLAAKSISKEMEEIHKRLLDFRFPHEWFPATRAMQRTIHVHVGPTNSGKTYNALKALENSKRGVYAGPLRLLATEVYQRLNSKNIPCALLTGEEMRIPENTDNYFSSCTVEMTPLNRRFDVAVIDEIQMISDPERGSSWTTALLGVQAKEVHVCGEERAVKLIQSICRTVGDECIVHRYNRLSPLETMAEPVGNDFNKLQKGDAIVGFSRISLHSLKTAIEKKTGRRCAIIYGSLPPEVRVQQAALFNDPNNDYDFIVASDAIGMGLNLEIKRVVMESVNKFDGSHNRVLTCPEIKQIGGRAGRFRSAANPGGDATEEKKMGYVTAMDKPDLRVIARAFRAEVDDLTTAYINPPAAVVERFATYFPPKTPLSFILMRIRELATVGPNYEMGISSDIFKIADEIHDLPLTIYDRLTLCHLPVSLRAERALDVLGVLAAAIANNSRGDLLSFEEIPLEFLDTEFRNFNGEPKDYLTKLEALHIAINQYVWLSYRYNGIFRDQALAFHVRSLVEQRLIETLDKMDFTEEDLQDSRSRRRQMTRLRKKERKALGERDLVSQEKEEDVPDGAIFWRP